MALRVVQWATGGVGVAAIKGVLEHPELELVGCWVHSADKAGKDVGEIIGEESLGVTATNNVDEILALDADAVIYSPLLPNPDEVAALLRSGKNVVTPGRLGCTPASGSGGTDARGGARGQRDAARHRHGARRHQREVPAAVLGVLHWRDIRSRRGVSPTCAPTRRPMCVRHVMGFGEVPEKALSADRCRSCSTAASSRR